MFQAYAIASLIGPEDPREARDRANLRAWRDAMIAAGCAKPLADRIRTFLATCRWAELVACRA